MFIQARLESANKSKVTFHSDEKVTREVPNGWTEETKTVETPLAVIILSREEWENAGRPISLEITGKD